MSTDYRLYGFTAPSEKFLAYKAIRDNCHIADVEVPEEVEEFFENYMEKVHFTDFLLEQGYGEYIELTPPSMNFYNEECKRWMELLLKEQKVLIKLH